MTNSTVILVYLYHCTILCFCIFLYVEHGPQSPAPPGPAALVIVVMTRHGALYPLLLPLRPQVIRLQCHQLSYYCQALVQVQVQSLVPKGP